MPESAGCCCSRDADGPKKENSQLSIHGILGGILGSWMLGRLQYMSETECVRDKNTYKKVP
jgi:hypothetical protein